MNSEKKKAALFATAVTIPFIVILAFAIGALTGKNNPSDPSSSARAGAPLPGVSVAPVPSNSAAENDCVKVMAKLPVTLDYNGKTLPGRPALSTSTSVAAWGDPAIVFRCGVPRPKGLVPGSSSELFSVNGSGGVYWLPDRGATETVWTTVDRAVYVEVTVPNSYRTPPLQQIATAISDALPAVCSTDPAETDVSKLCTRRP